jgi:hypothetical protein
LKAKAIVGDGSGCKGEFRSGSGSRGRRGSRSRSGGASEKGSGADAEEEVQMEAIAVSEVVAGGYLFLALRCWDLFLLDHDHQRLQLL